MHVSTSSNITTQQVIVNSTSPALTPTQGNYLSYFEMGPSPNIKLNDYRQLAHQAEAKIQSYLREDHQTWSRKKSNKIIVHSRPSTEFNGKLFVAETVLNYSPEIVFELIVPGQESNRTKWDKTLKEIDIIEVVEKDLLVQKCIIAGQAGGAISSREFIDLVLISTTADAVSTTAISIDHPACPKHPKYVRGLNYPLGIVCSRIPSDPNKCRVTNIVQTDPCGKVPNGLVDTVMSSIVSEFFPQLEVALAKATKENIPNIKQ